MWSRRAPSAVTCCLTSQMNTCVPSSTALGSCSSVTSPSSRSTYGNQQGSEESFRRGLTGCGTRICGGQSVAPGSWVQRPRPGRRRPGSHPPADATGAVGTCCVTGCVGLQRVDGPHDAASHRLVELASSLSAFVSYWTTYGSEVLVTARACGPLIGGDRRCATSVWVGQPLLRDPSVFGVDHRLVALDRPGSRRRRSR